MYLALALHTCHEAYGKANLLQLIINYRKFQTWVGIRTVKKDRDPMIDIDFKLTTFIPSKYYSYIYIVYSKIKVYVWFVLLVNESIYPMSVINNSRIN
jgi:hypothetical protein